MQRTQWITHKKIFDEILNCIKKTLQHKHNALSQCMHSYFIFCFCFRFMCYKATDGVFFSPTQLCDIHLQTIQQMLCITFKQPFYRTLGG